MSQIKYFSWAELTKTCQKLDNSPKTWEQVTNLCFLAEFLDNVREKFAKPIRVNCAFRSPEVNAAVGGVATSAHLQGCAADICAWSGTEADNRLLLRILENELAAGRIDQLISYHRTERNPSAAIRFIHVGLVGWDSGKVNRCQRLYK